MRIAQVSPLFESVPPRLYGGTERVVSYLTEELVKQGHEVTLFASGDSVTRAQLVPVCPVATRLDPSCSDPMIYHMLGVQTVADRAGEFDIIHFHNDYLHYAVSSASNYCHVTTLHGRLDLPDLLPLYKRYAALPLVSISNHQRGPLPHANWVNTIYHGLPEDLYTLGKGEGGYLAFIGRISPEKRPDRAIEIAKRTGIPLKIAAKVDKADQVYYEEQIAPLLDHPLIEFVGEIGEAQKAALLGNALALLFPIDWPEPFGMVMIEALANGTPVIAFGKGSVPEVIDHGESGYVVNSVEEAIAAVNGLHRLDRRHCREIFEQRFSVRRMALQYVLTYDKLLHQKQKTPAFNRNGKPARALAGGE